MFGKRLLFHGRSVGWLICILITGMLIGCTPKILPSMSPEDLQTCDETAASNIGWTDPSKPSSTAQPYLVRPGQVDITSPNTGSILPNGKSVVINFTQPTANAGVLYRNYRVLVTSLTGTNLDWIGDQYAVVTQPPNNFQVTWNAPKPGKYVIYVLIRNLETIPEIGGNTAYMGEQLEKKMMMTEEFDIHYGPFSMAYTCVKIESPSLASQQPGEILPLQNNSDLVPTITSTFTQTVTLISTNTSTPTLISTNTSTPTFVPPTFKPGGTPTCRQGPAFLYAAIGLLDPAKTYPLLGVTIDGRWYQLEYALNTRCWVRADEGQSSGDFLQVPVLPFTIITLTPTSTFTPTFVSSGFDCSSVTDENYCVEKYGTICKWGPLPPTGASGCSNK